MDKITRAIEIAYAMKDKSHSGGRCFHLSAVFNKSKIISIGVNNYEKTHPQIQRFGYHPFARVHSEMSAALKLGLTDCNGLTIVNVRIDRNNKVVNSLFCKGCQNLIRYLNFSRAFYTTDSGEGDEFLI